jgi:tyrosinase
MAGIRENILFSARARDRFLQGVEALDTQMSGVMASRVYDVIRGVLPTFRMTGREQELSYYDLFVVWHAASMAFPLAVGNAAHSGPVFLPWHRHYMILLEQWMQIVLGDPDFGLPYWDWAADGELPAAQQPRTVLWTASHLGEARGSVGSGRIGRMRVRLVGQRSWNGASFESVVASVAERRINRNAGVDAPALPRQADVARALEARSYDFDPWNTSISSHRNLLEGWMPPAAGSNMHNRVHVWVGGDMGPATSPNDPVFFLNHCNVDRIWEAWMARNGRAYAPGAGQAPNGHALDSAMFTLLGEGRSPQQVLNPAQWYDYDSLAVAPPTVVTP